MPIAKASRHLAARGTRSPSPRPSPAGRGGKSSNARSAVASLPVRSALRSSLAQRERSHEPSPAISALEPRPLRLSRLCGANSGTDTAEAGRTQRFMGREERTPRSAETTRCDRTHTLGSPRRGRGCPLSPGERVRVRGKGARFIPSCSLFKSVFAVIAFEPSDARCSVTCRSCR
jgi:hypothetical protein